MCPADVGGCEMRQGTPAARSASRRSLSELLADRRTVAYLDFGLLALGLAIYTSRSGSIFLDGLDRFNAVQQLATHGTLSDTRYSFWGPLFSLPLWPLGHVFQTPEWWLGRYNFFLFVLALGALWLVLKD